MGINPAYSCPPAGSVQEPSWFMSDFLSGPFSCFVPPVVEWEGSRSWSREPRSGAYRSLRPLWVLWPGRSPPVPCRACPSCSQVAGWAGRLAWWLPACVALVSEVLDTGVPHSRWGLVTRKVAERDPGSGQEAGRCLATPVDHGLGTACSTSSRLSRCWYLKG